ncbi:hypothetical protein [Sporosarcina sp. Te-1]|uniref:hypothetical protein n=1 Tax=Sporosarcina sp. Te-1 TaxID=2818390 RepID=UPI001A9D3B8A|nr:hypothetical protein [Sporosarcina sp. Te-1]QTD41949.1 hypothetical protein J3U78_03620 [Sporosarcina sp. Te-1]
MVIEHKKMIQHQLDNIERCNWTDEIDDAIVRTLSVYESLQKIRVMKNEKHCDSKMNFLAAMLQGQGVKVQVVHYGHKKTD